MANIDYYFYGASPFTYLAHKAFLEMARRNGASVAYKPVRLAALWEVSGAVPPAQRPPVRQRYRLIELQRCADFRGLPINVKPAFFPVDSTLADSAAIALVEAGHDPEAYLRRVFAGVWANEENIAERATVAGYLSAEGFDAEAILTAAESDAVQAMRERNSQEAIAHDAIGVPTFVLNGEPFWGQDRIELLEAALKSGRPAYKAV